ncbi:hypothetical protein [Flavobacterium mesophilum]|uniref:hypothetical protein n=1 Tax=Flavobacterium mesophilum TaxID=3143495 RepID=UPI0031D3B8E2
MQNITRYNYEKAYKEAIRTKYKNEKETGENSNFLEIPSQANLRDLCWKILSTNPSPDDLKVYWDFKGVPFNKNEEDTSTCYTDKYKKVGAFLRGEKEPQKIDTVDMAAILIDFEPRPFRKFKAKAVYEDLEVYGCKEDLSENENEQILEVSKTTGMPTYKSAINWLVEKKSAERKFALLRNVAITAVVSLIGVIIYLALPNKQCMQWSGDHYEIVTCTLNTNGYNSNPVELLDESLVNLKKIDISDNTVCFDKNGTATIWYGKTADGIDFFNGHGRHPENNEALKPVTSYILKKYAHRTSVEK